MSAQHRASARATLAATAGLLLGTLLAPQSASAAAPAAGALRGVPFAAFTEPDREMFLAAATALVSTREDGDERRWANDATGAWGKMKLQRSWRTKRGRCRELGGENTAAGRTDAFRIVMCASRADDWRVYRSGSPPRR